MKLRLRLLVLLLMLFTPLMTNTGTELFAQSPTDTATVEKEKSIDQRIDEAFKPVSDKICAVIFYSVPVGNDVKMPIVLMVLLGGALFCTMYFGFPNVTKLGLAIRTVSGKYSKKKSAAPAIGDRPSYEAATHTPDLNVLDDIAIAKPKSDAKQDEGEVSHFQALTTALSATVGLGNIAGVAVALSVGGPGATFWMIVAGFLGMASKFAECTLGVKYREVDADGTVHGGPMYYLSRGFAEKGMGAFGKVLAVFFAIMCVGGSFGGGNMFQANQAAAQVTKTFDINASGSTFIFGIICALLVGLIIIGGIRRIAQVTDKLVPFMALLYVGMGLIILIAKFSDIPAAFSLIFSEAFAPTAIAGGVLGAIMQGFKRAAFSNEAGVGSAAIAHSAVKTNHPASEGIVSLLEPFIDTVIICTMSALIIIVTNIDAGFVQYGSPISDGVGITSTAFESVIPGSSYILVVVVVLFAFSTMISWSYYGLQAWKYLFGKSPIADTVYKVIFCLFVVIGSSASLGAVIDFSDAMIFAMVFPNIIGLVILAPVITAELRKYLHFTKLVDSGKSVEEATEETKA